MSRETKTKEIDGYKYTCTQFPPQKSLRVLTKLTRYLGGPLASLMKSAKGTNVLDQNIEDLDFGSALMSLGSSMGDDDLYILAKDICESVVVNIEGSKPGEVSGQLSENTFDQHFIGPKGLKRLFAVAAFAIEVNYKDFLGDVVAGVGAAQAAT